MRHNRLDTLAHCGIPGPRLGYFYLSSGDSLKLIYHLFSAFLGGCVVVLNHISCTALKCVTPGRCRICTERTTRWLEKIDSTGKACKIRGEIFLIQIEED